MNTCDMDQSVMMVPVIQITRFIEETPTKR